MYRNDKKAGILVHKETFMKALVLTIIIALSGSFAMADASCPLSENSFSNNHAQDGALTRSNAVKHVNSDGQIVVDADDAERVR